ncbi:MAG: hypothetical protein MZV70_62805 [Desulfobacterales bacterium]|nr:hypothetical protein [Desulfobacterales bacterium]
MELEQLIAETAEDPPCGPIWSMTRPSWPWSTGRRASRNSSSATRSFAAEEARTGTWPPGGAPPSCSPAPRTCSVAVALSPRADPAPTASPGSTTACSSSSPVLLDRYWDRGRPQLDPDDDNDPDHAAERARAPGRCRRPGCATCAGRRSSAPLPGRPGARSARWRSRWASCRRRPDGAPLVPQDQVESMARAAVGGGPPAAGGGARGRGGRCMRTLRGTGGGRRPSARSTCRAAGGGRALPRSSSVCNAVAAPAGRCARRGRRRSARRAPRCSTAARRLHPAGIGRGPHPRRTRSGCSTRCAISWSGTEPSKSGAAADPGARSA